MKQNVVHIYNKISNKLKTFNFTSNIFNNDKHIENFINSSHFSQQLNNIINSNDFDIKTIINILKPIFDEIIEENNSENDYLKLFYQFTLSKSYPHTTKIEFNQKQENTCLLFLDILKIFNNYEKAKGINNIISKYPFHFLTISEEKKLRDGSEYKKFKKIFSDYYIYEMMQLHKELTGHNTIDHISGVHYLSLFIGRQLKNSGLPLDLGRVSGAAAGHDIGKYGCTGEELKRVPYFHYYYTDLWFINNNIPYIGHIATNHSTWDLELENLSLESLILIYADFRVKNLVTENKKREMNIFSLADSFEIILNKLDNVDAAKEKRYRKVYSKLKDFEDFMLDLGITVELSTTMSVTGNDKFYNLMHSDDIVQNIKYLAINHNINLMYKLRNESSLSSILDMARSETNSKNLRAYIEVIEEYSTYLTQNQKIITMKFLYELLTHKEEDIRKHCAALIGKLISTYDEKYRKEVPKNSEIINPSINSNVLLHDYISLFLFPDHKIIDLHREWITFGLRIMLASLFSNSSTEQKETYTKVLFKYYNNIEKYDFSLQFYLIQTIKYLPLIDLEDKSLNKMFEFILNMLDSEDATLRISALERIHNLLYRVNRNSSFIKKLKQFLELNTIKSNEPAENFLKYKIAERLHIKDNMLNLYNKYYKDDFKKGSDIFLKNLKSATNWIIKKVNIELLLQQIIDNPNGNCLHSALHLCNLLKVSAIENVRSHAGEALINIVPFLSRDQRNDVTVELLRALEIQGYRFTKYIPKYLGQIMLYLHPVELDEIINDFIEKVRTSNNQINFLLIKTIGVTIENYPKYKNFYNESEEVYEKRFVKMLGILLTGLASYDEQVKQEAFGVIGRDILGSSELSLEEKLQIFTLTSKKILALLPEDNESELMFLSNSASLNHIYRFIGDYNFFIGDIKIDHPNKIAFFPGTFDPISIGHKEIAKSIRDLGFEVFLAVDEFSWSKNTQPHKLRRKLLDISISNELNIYLFPEDIPINISNSKNLDFLKSLFKNSELYVVVGSDVIINASSYSEESNNYIQNFNHIIFERESNIDSDKLENKIKKIKGSVIRLALPPKLKNISSTQIREYVDDNRDISQLIDPLAQKFIYDYGLYRKEPLYKTLLQTKSLNIEVIDTINDEIIEKLSKLFFNVSKNELKELNRLKEKLNPRILIIRNTITNDILGFSIFHWVRSSSLFSHYKDDKITEYIRNNSIGRIVAIDGIFTKDDQNKINLEQILLTETLSFCIAKDYNYCVFKSVVSNYSSNSLIELFRLHGFIKVPNNNEEIPTFAVSMDNPCTLYLDTETYIKEPFKSNVNVIKTIYRSRKRLQRVLTKLYPGELVISFDKGMIYQSLIRKICETNEVPISHQYPRKLGNYMCIPFGSILKGEVVPNTVTKSMHTDKMFEPDIKEYSINSTPYYMSMENQIKMLKSFDRSVILVDDLLNKGYRIKSIDPLLKKENITVKKIIVGILSGRGKELMDIQGREVDSAYFIPNLKLWFNESALYPFIGGNTVWRGVNPKRNLLKSINFILPYKSPTFIKGVSNEIIFELSKTAITNSIDILSTLEKEYQVLNKKSMTLKHLSEVITSPRCPDKGNSIEYDLNLKPSQYLLNDLEQLNRIESIIFKD